MSGILDKLVILVGYLMFRATLRKNISSLCPIWVHRVSGALLVFLGLFGRKLQAVSAMPLLIGFAALCYAAAIYLDYLRRKKAGVKPGKIPENKSVKWLVTRWDVLTLSIVLLLSVVLE